MKEGTQTSTHKSTNTKKGAQTGVHEIANTMLETQTTGHKSSNTRNGAQKGAHKSTHTRKGAHTVAFICLLLRWDPTSGHLYYIYWPGVWLGPLYDWQWPSIYCELARCLAQAIFITGDGHLYNIYCPCDCLRPSI